MSTASARCNSWLENLVIESTRDGRSFTQIVCLQAIDVALKGHARAVQLGAVDSVPDRTTALHNALLNVDIRKRGVGHLPDAIATVAQGSVAGPLVVQLGQVVDVSKAAKVSSASSDPLYCSQVSDGRITATAMAVHVRVPGFDADCTHVCQAQSCCCQASAKSSMASCS